MQEKEGMKPGNNFNERVAKGHSRRAPGRLEITIRCSGERPARREKCAVGSTAR